MRLYMIVKCTLSLGRQESSLQYFLHCPSLPIPKILSNPPDAGAVDYCWGKQRLQKPQFAPGAAQRPTEAKAGPPTLPKTNVVTRMAPAVGSGFQGLPNSGPFSTSMLRSVADFMFDIPTIESSGCPCHIHSLGVHHVGIGTPGG